MIPDSEASPCSQIQCDYDWYRVFTILFAYSCPRFVRPSQSSGNPNSLAEGTSPQSVGGSVGRVICSATVSVQL